VAELTAGALAAHLGLPIRGDAARRIAGAAPLEEAGPDRLVFVGAPKYFEAARASGAGCVIALPEYRGTDDQAVIESTQPRGHFAHALALLYPAPPISPGISGSAVVDPDACVESTAEIGPNVVVGARSVIGENVRVGAGASIGADVQIRSGTVIHPRVSIYDRERIEANCIIHSGAVIGADGFGFEMTGGRYRKVPQVGSVDIADDVEIGANSCIDRATLGTTIIGEGTKLDNMVHIAHNCRIGAHVVIAAQTGFAGGVSVGDYAIVGGQVGVGDKARIEARAVIGSGAGILTSKIVRAGEPVWGTPARPLRQYLKQLAALSRLGKDGSK